MIKFFIRSIFICGGGRNTFCRTINGIFSNIFVLESGMKSAVSGVTKLYSKEKSNDFEITTDVPFIFFELDFIE